MDGNEYLQRSEAADNLNLVRLQVAHKMESMFQLHLEFPAQELLSQSFSALLQTLNPLTLP